VCVCVCVCVCGSTGEVSLWTKDTTAKAAAGALVGQFKKNSHWNLESTSTFVSQRCLTAVRDSEVARKAEWDSLSDYPQTGQSVDAFLTPQQHDSPLAVDGKIRQAVSLPH
jgi:hypothetical protein